MFQNPTINKILIRSVFSKLFWTEGTGSRTIYRQGTPSRTEVVEIARYPALTGRETRIMFHPELDQYVFLRDKMLYLYDPVSREVSQIDTNGEEVRTFSVGPRGSIIFSTFGRQVWVAFSTWIVFAFVKI